MRYNKTIKKAVQIAYEAHQGQLDKGGYPYILHPLHLAEEMEDEATTVTALLHDVVEDTPITLQDLEKVGFESKVLEAIALLTHKKGVPYMDYVRAVGENPLARRVKLADLRHNLNLERIRDFSPVDDRRREKYLRALAYLEGITRKREGRAETEPKRWDRTVYTDRGRKGTGDGTICARLTRGVIVIGAGAVLFGSPKRDGESERYHFFANTHDIHIILDGALPTVDFYPVPMIHFVATDSLGGLIGSLGNYWDVDGDAPVYYVDRDKSCYCTGKSCKAFFADPTGWREGMVLDESIRLYPSFSAARAELEFIEDWD